MLYESVGLFGWSAGFEWELVKNLRLIGEYTDRHTREEVPDLDEPAVPRDTAFAALDLIVPLARQELGFTAAASYDWSGGELAATGTCRLDSLNGIRAELSGVYFDVLERTDATTDLFDALARSLLFALRVEYLF